MANLLPGLRRIWIALLPTASSGAAALGAPACAEGLLRQLANRARVRGIRRPVDLNAFHSAERAELDAL